MQLQRTTTHSAHEIFMTVVLNTGTRVVDEDHTVLTHTLQCLIDEEPFIEKPDLTDEEVITAIGEVKIQAERRIDIIGTPEDSPLVTQLIEMGFTL